VHEVIARIVDGSEFHEFKPLYGSTLVTGFAHIWGIPVAILSNNGILFSESALKAPILSSSPASGGPPLLFLQTSLASWSAGSTRPRASPRTAPKLVTAVATASVPKINRLIGGSFGAGNYGMAAAPTAHASWFTWPNSRISVMGGEQGPRACSPPSTATPANGPRSRPRSSRQPIRDDYEAQGNPWHATRTPVGRWYHRPGTDPRTVLGLAFAACLNASIADARSSACSACDDDRNSSRGRLAGSIRQTAARRKPCRRPSADEQAVLAPINQPVRGI